MSTFRTQRTQRPMSSRYPSPMRQRPTTSSENNIINEQWLDQFVDEHELHSGSDNGFSDEEDEDMMIVAQTTTPQNISGGLKVQNGRSKYAPMHASNQQAMYAPVSTSKRYPNQARLSRVQPVRAPAPTPAERLRRQGTREQVWNGTAERTKGGLVKGDLLSVPMGIDKSTGETVYKLVSKKRSEHAKKVFGYADVRN